jgi:hypothetical protein
MGGFTNGNFNNKTFCLLDVHMSINDIQFPHMSKCWIINLPPSLYKILN